MCKSSPARAQAATLWGVDARIVNVEVMIDDGPTQIEILGLLPSATRESRERVRAALRSGGFDLGGKSILVNLTPTDLSKEAAPLDLAIALTILVATGDLPQETLDGRLICGELGLDGAIRSIRGGLAMAELGHRLECRELLLPAANAAEAAALGDAGDALPVIGLKSLSQALLHLKGVEPLTAWSFSPLAAAASDVSPDLSEVRGQETAKRALEVAAAGGHNLLFLGPSGSGKTMLARRFPGLLPPLTPTESIICTKIHSLVAEEPQAGLRQIRPFRSPHSSASTAGVLGGGSGGVRPPRPGEATLAHCGVLFLDELPDFGRPTLEALRAPLETGVVTLLRPGGRVQLPARFSLIAAMSPCPCGHLGDPRFACTCSAAFIRRFRDRISGLADRLDLHVEVPAVSLRELRSGPGETSAQIARRVAAAQAVQISRFGPGGSRTLNAAMTSQQVRAFCALDAAGRSLLEAAFEKLGLSVATRDCILKVARTIADLAGSDAIRAAHLAEAIHYRRLDASVAR